MNMTFTSDYATWAVVADDGSDDATHFVTRAIGEHVADFDIDQIVDEWITAVNSVLPDGVDLHARDLYGPADGDREAGIAATREAIASTDLWEIAERHQRIATGPITVEHLRQLADLGFDNRGTPAVLVIDTDGEVEVEAFFASTADQKGLRVITDAAALESYVGGQDIYTDDLMAAFAVELNAEIDR